MMRLKAQLIENYPLKEISKKKMKGYRMGNLTVLFPNTFKNPKKIRNLLLSSNKILKQLCFCKPKNIKKINEFKP